MVGVIAGIIVLGEIITMLDMAGVLVTGRGIVVVLVAQQRASRRAADGDRDAAAAGEITLPDGAELPEPRPRTR